MTTPPEEPAVEPAPDAQSPPTPAVASAPATPTAPAPVAYAPPLYADPAFAPVLRAPRTPWVNPAKRAQAAIIAVVAALVLLFGGLAVGFAAGHHRAERMNQSRFDPGYGPQANRPGAGPRNDPFGGRPAGPNNHRKIPFPGAPSATPSPTRSG